MSRQHQDPGGPAAAAPPGDDVDPRSARPAWPLGLTVVAVSGLLLAPSGCSTHPEGEADHDASRAVAASPSRVTKAVEGGAHRVASEIATRPPPDVGRPSAGPESTRSGPSMNFTDPDTLADSLLWLRADRGVHYNIAAHWDGVTNTRLQGPSGDGLETGDVDFGFACWVRVNALPTAADPDQAETHIAGKWSLSSNPAREWLLCLNSPDGPNQFRMLVRDGSTSTTVYGPHSTLPGGIEPGRWYFVVAWHDAAHDSLNLSVDGSPFAPVGHAGGLPATSAPFHLGAAPGTSGFPAISLAHAIFFKAPLGGIGARIDEIIAGLYDEGRGADYQQLTPDQLLDWGVVAAWPLSNRDGQRENVHPGSGNLNLSDPSQVGSTFGPLFRPIRHDQEVTHWIDQVGGRQFSPADPSVRVLWRGDSTRIVSAMPSERLEHNGLVLSGHPQWTLTITAAPVIRRAFAPYAESSNSRDDDYLEVRVTQDGYPELAIKQPGSPEAIARASDTIIGRRPASIASVEQIPLMSDGVPRVRCRVFVGEGHPFATGDRVGIRGLGPPFDGSHVLTYATTDELQYVVDNPETAPDRAGARRIDGRLPSQNPSNDGLLADSIDCRLNDTWSGTEWTIAGWVRKTSETLDAHSGGAGIFAAKDSADFRDFPSRPHIIHDGGGTPGSYRLAMPGGPSADFGPASKDTWIHLAAVRSGNVITLYYNGVASQTLDLSATPEAGSMFTGIGFGFDSTITSALPCLLDNWGIWLGRGLSAAEVSTLYGGGAGVAFAGLAEGLKSGMTAWYDFDEVSGLAIDASGNGHDLIDRGLISAAEGIGGGIPFESAVSRGEAVGTGRFQISGMLRTDYGPGQELLRSVLTVRRDGGTVSFFRDGTPIGSAEIDPALLGPESGTTRIIGGSDRLGAAFGSVEHVHAVGQALPDEEAIGLASRFSVRVNRTRGVGPLAVQFDATRFTGVDRMTLQDYHFLWAFVRADDGQPHDDFRSIWSGQAYARSTGFFVSQVFETEGQYDVYLAVVTPPYDRQGNAQPQTCLRAGKVATITVDPWPTSTVIYYVSSNHPNRSNSHIGTSPDAPLSTVGEAVSRVNRPFTQVLLKNGEEFQIHTNVNLTNKTGPVLLGTYGDPEASRPTLIASKRSDYPNQASVALDGSYDVRVSGIAIQDTGVTDPGAPDYHKLAFNSNGDVRLLLLHDLVIRDTHRFYYPDRTDRSCTIDKIHDLSKGDYTIFAYAPHDFSVTRTLFDGSPELHYVRCQTSHRIQFAHNDRTIVPWQTGTGWGTWLTIRHEAGFNVVTDNNGHTLSFTIEAGQHRHLGPQAATVERNKLTIVDAAGDQFTLRGNYFTSEVAGVQFRGFPDAVRAGQSEGHMIYGNLSRSDKHVYNFGNSSILVNDDNMTLGAEPLTVPPIGLATAGHHGAILAADNYGAGSHSWRFRWMRRPAGSTESFAEVVGQNNAAIFDSPLPPGSYEYRLDLIDSAGNEAIGQETVTIDVQDDGTYPPEPDSYTLTPPVPASGIVGQPSAPFTVALEEAPAGPVSITPSSDGPGSFDPAILTLTPEAPSATFSFTPSPTHAGIGTWEIATSNDAGLIDPSPVTFVATVIIENPENPLPVEAPPTGPPSPTRPPRPTKFRWPLKSNPGGSGRSLAHSPLKFKQHHAPDRDQPAKLPPSLAPRPPKRGS